MKKYTFRKFIGNIHLWFGFISGIILFIVCLTGTIYTFADEIERFFNPDQYYVKTKNHVPLSTQKLINDLENSENGKVTNLFIHEDKARTYQLSLSKNNNDNAEKKRPERYFVNQYTGEITGKGKNKSSEFFTFIMKAHRWLLIEGEVGRIIVGISTIIFIFLLCSGMVLWIPKKLKRLKQFKPGFKIKFNANWKRINHDLHNTLGFYSCFFLLVMALTGLCWSFEWYKNGLSAIMGSEVFAIRSKKPSKIESKETNTISLDSIINKSNSVISYTGNYSVSFPKDLESCIVISRTKNGFFASPAYDRVEINPYDGEIIKVEKFSDKTLNDKIVSLIKPLHLGDVFGTFSKILYFIFCLIATSLPITGIIIWLNKRKKARK